MLNIVHHTPQHLQEVLSGRTTKSESLHEVTTAAIDHHQMRNTVIGDSKAMEIHIRRPKTPKVRRIKVINLGYGEGFVEREFMGVVCGKVFAWDGRISAKIVSLLLG